MQGRLIIHTGLHKTGTTTFQKLIQAANGFLRERGTYVPKVEGYPAYHNIARSLILGDTSFLLAEIENAKKQGQKNFLISSEQFTFSLYNQDIARTIEMTGKSAGFETIWAFVLRRPGEYFWSLYDEFPKHSIYVDALAWFDEVVRTGRILMITPGREPQTMEHWFFPFDYDRYLNQGFKNKGHQVRYFSFEENYYFPGEKILSELCLNTLEFDALLEQYQKIIRTNFNQRMHENDLDKLKFDSLINRLEPIDNSFHGIFEMREKQITQMRKTISENLNYRFKDYKQLLSR